MSRVNFYFVREDIIKKLPDIVGGEGVKDNQKIP